ncbi:MAG TPA: alpha/beta hydrolase [Chitinophagales bacterium]|nr:alpha/beta hydrolase [Chitinophagales bacterium]
MFKKIISTLLLIAIVLVTLFIFIAYGRKNLILSKEYVKEKYRFSNSHFITWKGGELHYTDSGKGIPILMIHGFGGSNWDFRILDSLLNDKYRVIRVDLPGFGLSDFPKQIGTNPDYIAVYNAYFNFLIDTLHIDTCYVMGNSLGGLMSWNLAVNRPDVVKKLVLFNSAGYDMKAVMKTARADEFRNPIVQLVLKKGIPIFLTKNGMNRVFYNKKMLTQERTQRINDLWNRAGNLQQIINMALSDAYPNPERIKQIECPTLIVWGKQDIIINPKYAAQFHADIKNSREIIYDSCGHVPMMEKPMQVQHDVLTFLQYY